MLGLMVGSVDGFRKGWKHDLLMSPTHLLPHQALQSLFTQPTEIAIDLITDKSGTLELLSTLTAVPISLPNLGQHWPKFPKSTPPQPPNNLHNSWRIKQHKSL